MRTDTTRSASQSRRVLVADDCATSRLAQELILRLGGFEVTCVSNGEAALSTAVADRPDVILLDLEMPLMDGLDVLAILKRSPATRRIPVVIVTLDGDPSVREAALAAGCDAFLTKPFDATSLAAIVGQVSPPRDGAGAKSKGEGAAQGQNVDPHGDPRGR